MTARFFNTAGPVRPLDHYCLPPLTRFDLAEVLTLLDQKKYFVLHAPRQTGKTSYLLALMEYLNRQGDYRCLYANLEIAQSAREDVGRAMQAILGQLAGRARDFLNDPTLLQYLPTLVAEFGPDGALESMLTLFARSSPKPLVLLLDEVDSLVGDTLISLLRQLRAGYDKRPALFPHTIILCGVRDVRDYRIHSTQDKTVITGGSAFNIKAESLRLGDFSRTELEELYLQHTTETGQIFEPEALALAWELTQGQPWLVNALGYETCFKMAEGRDRSHPITTAMMWTAKENLILRRETHLDQLADKLQEERVRQVIEPLLLGVEGETGLEDHAQYVVDLGLIRRKPHLTISNPIYREIIPRMLTSVTQDTLTQQPAWYIGPDGRLNLDSLLTAFQEFFREHSEHWLERFDYKEAGPQLLLQAFLQRIVNGGGRIEREYGLGRRRTDLLVIWPYADGQQKVVIELKILYRSLEQTIKEGLEQTWQYADRCNAGESHLVIFNRDSNKSWTEKIFHKEVIYQSKPIKIWGV